MCIRDSHCLVHLLRHFGSRRALALGIREDVHFGKAALLGKFPVSYTHLAGAQKSESAGCQQTTEDGSGNTLPD